MTLCEGTSKILTEVILKQKLPAVIDADGLNALGLLETLVCCGDKVILTPHPGEAARLLKTNIEKVQSNRQESAIALSKKYSAICILKGYESVIAFQDKVVVNQTGNPGMATAGAGDVLSGIIGALLNQVSSVFEAAILSTKVHGLAGDIAAKKYGQISMTATDIIDSLPPAFANLKLHF
jgi:NAD(P)H-hydrate epimerase